MFTGRIMAIKATIVSGTNRCSGAVEPAVRAATTNIVR
jgi:hypothetical protein